MRCLPLHCLWNIHPSGHPGKIGRYTQKKDIGGAPQKLLREFCLVWSLCTHLWSWVVNRYGMNCCWIKKCQGKEQESKEKHCIWILATGNWIMVKLSIWKRLNTNMHTMFYWQSQDHQNSSCVVDIFKTTSLPGLTYATLTYISSLLRNCNLLKEHCLAGLYLILGKLP